MESNILISDNQGIYIPQCFVKNFDMELWGLSGEDCKEDIASILEGPGSEYYWESWENILVRATLIDEEGKEWYLWQDGDLFAQCGEVED